MTRCEWMRPCISAATGLLLVMLFAQRAAIAQTTQETADLEHDARVKWLAKNAVNVRSGDPRDGDFRDLAPLRKIIGDSRIVMLGEASHGDGATFLAKTRLIKFLHQEMGFDVLVFEGGVYDMSKVWESLRAGDDSPAALKQGMFGVWGTSEQVHPLVDYIVANAQTKRPLELAGFDAQMTGTASGKHLIGELGAFLNEMGIKSDLLGENGTFRTILENVLANKYGDWMPGHIPVPSPAEQKEYRLRLDQLEKDIAAKHSGKDNQRAGTWEHVLRSLSVNSQLTWQSTDSAASEWYAGMLREAQGAHNMLWLANERYQGQKLIVWAATSHVIRNKGIAMSQVRTAFPGEVAYFSNIPMGQHVWESLGNQVYVLGFAAYEGSQALIRNGKTQYGGPIARGPHTGVEMEELFNAAGFQYAILDFRSPPKGGDWLKTPIRGRYLGSNTGLRDWTKTMDGMFFIREQKPNTEWVTTQK